MPYINATIPKAWRMRGEPDRIHFTFATQDGRVRRLYADRGTGLFTMLEQEMAVVEESDMERAGY